MTIIRFLFIAILFVGIQMPGIAQSDYVECSLVNLYHKTLSTSPSLQRQDIQFRLSEADRRMALSAFDYQLYSDLSLNRSGENLFDFDARRDVIGGRLNTHSATLSAGIQRRLRSGMTLSAGINHSRIGDNFPLNAFNENVGGFIANNVTNATLSLKQPLLRGRGRSVTTANERIADISIKRQQWNTQFVASGEVLNMAAGYWNYLAAAKSLEVYRSNQSRVLRVLNITKELVDADKKPSSELLQIQADLKDKERQTITAEQRWYAARQNLGRAIGLSTIESEKLDKPVNDFPKIDDLSNNMRLEDLLEIAYENRTDLKAIRNSLAVLSVYGEVAKNNLKPQLDLNASLSYGGQDTGNGLHRIFTPFSQSQGRNYRAVVGLNYVFPVQNNAAKSSLRSSQLQISDREIHLKDQIRNIELNVSIAYNNLINSVDAVKKSKESLDFYTEVFENEQYKFQTGLTTLLNLILFQERLTFAQLDYINSQLQYAVAISNLRYETGTILSENHALSIKGNSKNPEVFYTLPRE